MTAIQHTVSDLICDGCGEHYGAPMRHVDSVRAEAKISGWKHQQVPYPRRWTRQIDLCPKCEEPR